MENELGKRISSARIAAGLSQSELAERVGVRQTTISAIESGANASPRKWRELASALAIPEDELLSLSRRASDEKGRTRLSPDVKKFAPMRRPVSPIGGGVRRLPVYGRATGGVDGEYVFNGEILDYEDCPPELLDVPDAYAVYIGGDSMAPRYESGDVAWVHPGKPAKTGNGVVVQVAHENGETETPRGYVKNFVRWTENDLVLRQLNPEKELAFPRGRVVSVHTIRFIKPA